MARIQSNTADLDVDLRTLFSSLRRRWKRVLGVSVAVGALAFALASMATPQYRSETRLLIETRESVFTRPNTGADGDRPILDEEGVTSQVEVITSSDILANVARSLDLASREEFDDAINPSLPKRLMVLAGLESDPAEIPPEERVLSAFREKLRVYRVERSRVIVVQFSSEDPKLAAQVPNAVADAYIALQRDAKLSSNSDATAWLEPEIATLTQRVKDAEARVAQYRAQSDLLMGQNNSVLATQQLSELSSELSRVRAARGAAEAAAAGVRGGSVDAIPEVLRSPLIQRLRERQVQLRADIADLGTTLLDNHPRVRALRSQLADLDRQIAAEAQNVLRSLGSEAETARLREQDLVSQLNTLKAASARAGEEEVELRALDREATAQRQLLESYLTRYREASSRRDGNYLPADARVFSRAITPSEAYFPKVLPIAAAAFVASLLLMAVATLLGELFSGRAMRPAGRAGDEDVIEPVEAVAMPPVAVPVEPARAASPQSSAAEVAAMAAAVEAAGSAEARRTGSMGIVRAAQNLVIDRTERVVFVSPEGDEAAAVSVMVAREVADKGLRVLLLDLSASGAASLPMLDSDSYPGITNLLASEAQFADIIHAELYSACHVIPVGTADPERAMRAADRLPIIMNSLTTAYDLVVVECGPTDATGIARLTDNESVVMVSAIDDAEDAVAETMKQLAEGGYQPLRVSPAGYKPPQMPEDSRSAA